MFNGTFGVTAQVHVHPAPGSEWRGRAGDGGRSRRAGRRDARRFLDLRLHLGPHLLKNWSPEPHWRGGSRGTDFRAAARAEPASLPAQSHTLEAGARRRRTTMLMSCSTTGCGVLHTG